MIQPWVYRGGRDLWLKSHHFRFCFSLPNFFKYLLFREIIVLDFGDESTNPYDFDQTTTPTPPGGNCKCCHHLFLYHISHLVFVEEFEWGWWNKYLNFCVTTTAVVLINFAAVQFCTCRCCCLFCLGNSPFYILCFGSSSPEWKMKGLESASLIWEREPYKSSGAGSCQDTRHTVSTFCSSFPLVLQMIVEVEVVGCSCSSSSLNILFLLFPQCSRW